LPENIAKSIGRFLLPILIIAIGIAVFAVFLFTKPKAEEHVFEERVWAVTSQNIRLVNHTSVIKLLGVVQSPHPTQLTAAIEAEVREISVDDGDHVARDQRLIILKKNEVQFNLKERTARKEEIKALIEAEIERHKNDQANLIHEKALLKLNQRAVERAKDLEKRNLASRTQLDEAQQNLIRQKITLEERRYRIAEYPSRLAQLKARQQQAAAQEQRALFDVEHTVIKAPFDGRIVDIKVGVGERIKKGNALIHLYKQNDLEIKAKIPLRYMAVISQAIEQATPLPVWAMVTGQREALTLTRIAATIDPGQGSVDCFFTFTNQHLNWPTGLNVELHLSLETHSLSALVPREALYGKNLIYRIHDNRLESLHVKVLGNHQDEAGGLSQVIIQSKALNNNDTILTTKFANAINGLKVTQKTVEQ